MASPIVVENIPSQTIQAKKDYPKMAYDQDNTLVLLEEIKSLSDQVQKDVDQIVTNFGTLQGKYDEFTDYNEIMNQVTSKLQTNAETIASNVTQIMQALSENLAKLVEQDDSLKDDIQALTDLLNNGELPETFGY